MSTLLAPFNFTFNADRHEYRVGARVIPSCSSLLVSGGLVSFAHAAQDAVERKGELGREVHRACHLHNLGKLGEYDPRVKPRLHAWLSFKDHSKSFRLISTEYQCVAEINGMKYGMQSDTVAMVDGYETIIELKIGRVLPHHGIQLAGYAAGLPHPKYTAPLARFMSRKRMVVELRENGQPKVHLFEQKSDFDVFCSLLHLTTWKNLHEKVYREERA